MRVLAFARLRELLGAAEIDVELPEGASVRDLWKKLVQRAPEIEPLIGSTRVARNDTIVGLDERLAEADDVALLPPAGGG